jgi:hypothetical protein
MANNNSRNRRAYFIERLTSDPDFAEKRQAEWMERKAKRNKVVN